MTDVRIRRFATRGAVARVLARRIATAVRHAPDIVLGLPTGRTPVPLYRELVALHHRGELDLSQASTFNLDEFVGIGRSHPGSYRAFMERHLFAHVNVPARHIHFLDGTAADLDRECARYERAIRRAGGLDLVVLGLGANGHIGFNEPGRHLLASTHRTRLTAATRAANAALFGGRASSVPREALSMGMATILHARCIVLVATGKAKARCVRRALHGPLTPELPASFLQLHRNVEFWLDRAASADL